MISCKKAITALAIASCALLPAIADAGVRMYGLIDAGVTHFSGIAMPGGGGSTASTGLSSGVAGGSRIGLEGSQALGSGLKALFDVETGFCGTGLSQDAPVGATPDGANFCGGGGFMQRQAYVGLSGRFGTILAGRMYTLQFVNEVAKVDPFGWGMSGAASNLSVLTQEPGLARTDQTLQYTSPAIAGITAQASYSFAPGNGGTVATAQAQQSRVPRSWDLDLAYRHGAVTAGVNDARLLNLVVNPATQVNDGGIGVWQVYGAYDFRVARLSGIYERASPDYSGGHVDSWLLGASIPVGPAAILVSYEATRNTTLAGGPSAHQIALGYDYSLSRQTDLYASYARIDNRHGAAFGGGDATDFFSGVANQTATGITVGMRHQF